MIRVPVNKIQFDYSYAKHFFYERGVKSDYLREYVKTISLLDIYHWMAFTATNFVTEWISAYPNCKEFLITYSKWKDKEIKDFLDLLDINIDKLGKMLNLIILKKLYSYE